MTSRRLRLIFGEHDECNAERRRKGFAFLRLHRNRIANIEKLSAQGGSIEIKSTSIDQLLHGPASFLVCVAKLLDQGSHP